MVCLRKPILVHLIGRSYLRSTLGSPCPYSLSNSVIMTRSRTKQSTLFSHWSSYVGFLTNLLSLSVPTEYEMIPFHVKVLKLLVSELQQSGENALLAAQGKAVDKDLDVDAEDEDVRGAFHFHFLGVSLTE